MIQIKAVAGDTFDIVYHHKQNGVLTNLPEGFDYMIGLRRKGSAAVTTFSYQRGEIENTDTGVYSWRISHELSATLSDTVVVEMVLYNRDASFVQHCAEPIELIIQESFMNNEIDYE